MSSRIKLWDILFDDIDLRLWCTRFISYNIENNNKVYCKDVSECKRKSIHRSISKMNYKNY